MLFGFHMIIGPLVRNNLLHFLPLLERDKFLTGNLHIFNQFTLTVILITTINRLFCNGINGTFIEKDLFPPAFIAITDDCPVRTIGADIVIDETDDFHPFGNHLDFPIAKITNSVHLGIAAKATAVFLDPKSVDTVLPLFLQILIENLIFDQGN